MPTYKETIKNLRTLAGYDRWAPVHQEAFNIAVGELEDSARTNQQVADQNKLYAWADELDHGSDGDKHMATVVRMCAGRVGRNT